MTKYVRLLVALFLVFAVSCQKKPEDRLKSKQILRTAFPFDPSTLDPRRGSDPTASEIHFMLFEGLTRMTKESSHELGMASSIKISDDKLVYTFGLRKAEWSDGSPVTAHDFAYAWTTILDPSFPAPNAQLLYPVKNAEKVKKGELPLSSLGIRVIDDKTLEITLESPTPYFLDVTSFCVLFPVPHKIAEQNRHWADRPGPDFVTNGPFVLKSWLLNNQYVFEKNSHYWDKNHIQLDEIEASILSDENTVISMFQNHEFDFVSSTRKFSADRLTLLQREPGFHSNPVGATSFLTFQCNDPLLQNKHLRQALSFAVNRKNLVRYATLEKNKVAYGCIPPILKNGVEDFVIPDQDLLLAKEHLDLALKELSLGSPSDLSLKLLYSSNPLDKQLVQILQDEWRKILNISVTLEEHDFKIVMDRMNRKDFQIGLVEWAVQYNDSMNIFDRFKFKANAKNYSGWENQEYITLLNDSAYAKDAKERSECLKKAEEIFTKDYPVLCLFHFDKTYLLQERVKGMYISPVGSVHYNQVSLEEVK